jgi:Tol biopolymer transport system component
VPVNGSPVRELLDETESIVWSAAWSPDGTAIAFVRHACPPDEHAPLCFEGTFTLETLAVADGRRTAVAEGAPDFGLGFIWSPDGRRMALGDDSSIFVMDADGTHRAKVADARWSETTWSPDGEWLLFSTNDEALGTRNGPWIIAADGGEPRLLGSYGGWAW